MALAPVTPSTFRAIDWKNYLLYHFDLTPENGKLDKTFSFLAAEKICGKRPRTDHEADAICIAYCAYKASTLGTPGNGVA